MFHLHTDEMVCHAFWLYHPTDLCKVNTVKELTRDPFGTPYCRSFSDESIPLTVNLSLQGGQLPDRFKVGVIKPLLKKSGADHENFSNFQPVSNLYFLIILMVTRVYWKNFNQRINFIITVLKPHLSESIMTF